ncbi:hypothetical protein H2199_009104 [Coniosporium tulheliwenetii]|uniref:Uncharacterized protein n=1 Tax=Coniosporium tulheliwenetii TaxID=3383036 RepID=A0ACC2YFE2_9PEZI|nr:hypothetical protein H2199_009104 [Cladosporium sp. JES 115]
MVYVRAPTLPPIVLQPPRRWQILFRHPGYDDSNNVLFKLHAPDTDVDSSNDDDDDNADDNATRRPGLYAQLALDACAVIAGNRTDGWLSPLRDADAARNARVDAASTLHKRDYYFHLDREPGSDSGSDDPYAIVPTFREWRFPHDRIPAHWQRMAPNGASLDSHLLTLQPHCRLAMAHVVPQAELDWWKGNDMSRYNLGPADTLDDTANALLLRADLHIVFDKPRFTFVPKPACDGSGMRLVVHLLEPSAELEHLYHNRELHASAVGIEMLYARFAWSLFPLLGAFLSCRTNRRLAFRTPNGGLADSRGFVAAALCEQFSAAATRKRSQSPKKRKPEIDTVADATDTDIAEVDERAQLEDERKISTSASSGRKRKFSAEHADAEAGSSDDILPRAHIPGTCKEESDWARQVWAGKTLAGDEVVRWFEACGFEVRDV